MPRHDQRFKDLLRTFFPDFLRLVVPEAARRLDVSSLIFLDKELFTDWPEGRRREIDLLAEVVEVRGRSRRRGKILVHVEIERQARRQAAVRLHRYFGQLQARQDLPILSILVFLRGGPPGVTLESLPYWVLGEARWSFSYIAFGLSGCRAEDYLAKPEPLAWALAALMRPEQLSRAALKLACLRRIAAAELDEIQRFLLVNCVQFYLELTREEAVEYEVLRAQEEDREVEVMAMNWVERLENQHEQVGRREGIRQVLLRQLALRFGPLPDAVRSRVEAISSVARLNRLAEKVVVVGSLEEMGLG